MTNGLPTETEARRIGTHSGDGSDGLHVLETEEKFYVVGTFDTNLKAEHPTQVSAFLDFLKATYTQLSLGSKAPCYIAIEVRHGSHTIRIEQEILACDKVRTSLPNQLKAPFSLSY